ncbi:small ubiquitin-related modifier [Drosophila eugracilis]|uniref:small ubiquitin-related modifier n=1 Tax=Drosophila eugracilis TaxID=29029 RepID=UPI001BD99E3E|nr:small ubiquitin-related modifier [Drosophila eugracilis]
MANQSKTVWLQSSDTHKLQFQVLTEAPLSSFLKFKYYKATGVYPESVILLFNGMKIEEQDTFSSLDMEDDDVIDVIQAN